MGSGSDGPSGATEENVPAGILDQPWMFDSLSAQLRLQLVPGKRAGCLSRYQPSRNPTEN